MKAELYERIVGQYRQLRQTHGINQMRRIVDQLVEQFKEPPSSSSSDQDQKLNLDYPTLYSLVSYEYRKEARCCSSMNQCSKTTLELIEAEWNTNQSTDILQLADKYHLCAYSLLRQLTTRACDGNRDQAKRWLKDPSLVTFNERLAYEIMLLNAHDIMNGLITNQLNLNAGLAYELAVRKCLEHNGVSFLSEDDLRSRSYDVTPDFRLNVPLVATVANRSSTSSSAAVTLYRADDDAIPLPLNGEERLVVSWIECKALFASADLHQEYYESQFSSYANRFGNGLVLYQRGFVEGLPARCTRHLVLCEGMPVFAPPPPPPPPT